jgi:hypothetical protein
MQIIKDEFPFEEIRNKDGDYFNTVQEAVNEGYSLSQVWSVTESDGVISYGPSHHCVNLLGFTVTKEHHNGETYYEEDV